MLQDKNCWNFVIFEVRGGGGFLFGVYLSCALFMAMLFKYIKEKSVAEFDYFKITANLLNCNKQ